MSSRHALSILLLLALTLAAYAGVGTLGFVQLDDPGYLTQNPVVQRGLTAEGLRYAFTSTALANWHPVTWISHLLCVEGFGLEPAGHHWVNVLLHALSVVLLFQLLRVATDRPGCSLAVAALFAVHPQHVESVAWVAERKDVLSTPFWLLAMLAWVRWVHTGRSSKRTQATVLLLVGLASKAMLVTLPFALLLFDVWPLQRWSGQPKPGTEGASARQLVREKWPLFVLVAAFCLLTFLVQRSTGAVGSVERFPLSERLANSASAYLAYVEKTFWPTELAVFYPYPSSIETTRVVVAALFLVVVSALAVRWRRAFPPLFVGWFWYLGTLVPVIGLVQVGHQAYADRYTYVPHIGLFVALVWALAALVQARPALRRPVVGAGVVVVLTLVGVTRAQVLHWKDNPALFGRALAVTEDNAFAHDFYAQHLRRTGRHQEAIEHYRAALSIDPDLAVAHLNLGVALLDLNRVDEAIASLQEAIRSRPNFATAWSNLASAYGRQGRPDKALEAGERALEIDESDPSAHMNIAYTLLVQDRVRESVVHYRRALELLPALMQRPQVLAYAWRLATDPDDAVRDGAEAVRVCEVYCRATGYRDLGGLETLAAAYAEAGRFDDAVRTAEQALGAARAAGRAQRAARLELNLQALRSGRPLRSAGAAPQPNLSPGGR